jgi:hypothetical protein
MKKSNKVFFEIQREIEDTFNFLLGFKVNPVYL